ncbi:MAG: methyl-accepting chemotaxis protein, partial [Treponema sp.]|nr:methyl-accepting chemotaxis protein [Treponema sp.]
IGTSFSNILFPICKATELKESDGKTYIGCFVGFVPITFYHNTIPHDDLGFDSSEGFTVATTKDRNLLFCPKEEYVMTKKFSEIPGIKIITDAYSNSTEEIVSGKINYNGKDYFTFIKKGSFSNIDLITAIPIKKVYSTSDIMVKVLMISSILCTLLIIAGACLYLYLGLLPLKHLNKAMKNIAEGNADLTSRLNEAGYNEIGQITRSFNSVMEKLQEVIRNIASSKDSITLASSDLENCATCMDSEIGELTGAIGNMQDKMKRQEDRVVATSDSAKKISSSIQEMEVLIDEQNFASSRASAAVEQMVGNIDSVSHSTENMTKAFEKLKENSEKGLEANVTVKQKVEAVEIQSKTLGEANKIISNIAGQTNLLSMNAAIEAAHAGDSGRGFAVVAEEIRKLAEDSSNQSKSIKKQIKNISQLISEIVKASALADSINVNTESMMIETTSLVESIKNAMAEQTVGNNQILDSLKTMSKKASDVKSASQNMAKNNEAIKEEIELLNEETSEMKSALSQTAGVAEGAIEIKNSLMNVANGTSNAVSEIAKKIDGFKF